MTEDFSCKRRMRNRLWYGDYGRRRGVCKVFVRRNSLMKRWTTAKGDLRGCPVDQTFCWTSMISKVSNVNVKLKPMWSDQSESKQRTPVVSKVVVEELMGRSET